MRYLNTDGVQVNVPEGKGYKYQGSTYPVNTWTDEQRAEVGLFPIPPSPPPPPLSIEEERTLMVVTPWQFRKAVNATNKRGDINSLLNNPQTSQDVKDGWEVASSWERTHEMVIQFGYTLGMTDEDLDDLFRLAATL